ncbi:hypothetical protein J132_04057 [Termitomyces sp. J132]|nr:hypothetical protein H2248_004187 [Termitomyces sp. 'cryptogamus']KNZ72264.1 hypothetical protein J132_04057 [Termitomyces sp. J132]
MIPSVEDQVNHNDQPAQKFWSIYVDEATKHDANLTDRWKADLDSTLIFVRVFFVLLDEIRLTRRALLQVGLFSATVTAFISESYKLLQPDPAETTTILLSSVLADQLTEASHNYTSALNTVLPTSAFVRSTSAVTVNVLWFLSLSFSLTTALVVTLAQQWIRDYLQRVQRYNEPQRRGRARHFLFAGIERWKLETVVEYIPTLLHLSLFLFFAGLCVFLYQVDTLVAWLVLCVFVSCLAGYMFFTIVPLLDPSAPYETPLSFAAQRIHRLLYNILDKKALQSYRELKLRREREATTSTLKGDCHALLWTYKRITDDHELELFVTSIPGFLASSNGQDVWWATFAVGASRSLTVEISIVHFLHTILSSEHMDHESKRKRIIVCFDALFSIFCSEGNLRRKIGWTSNIDEESYEKFHLSFSSIVNDIRCLDWDIDNSLILKANGILALSHRPPRIANDYYSSPAASRYELSQRADKALVDVSRMRQNLEETIRVFELERSKSLSCVGVKTVENAMRAYIETLNTSSHLLARWMNVMGGTIQKNRWLSLLEWYTQLPSPDTSQTTILLPKNSLVGLPAQLDLYSVWMVATMRRNYVYPALPNFGDGRDNRPKTFDGQSRPLLRFNLEDHFLRELQPMLSAWCVLPEIRDQYPVLSRNIATCIKQLVGGEDRHYLVWPGPKHHKPSFFLPMGRYPQDQVPPELLEATIQRPFSMFTSIISDGIEGSRTLSLLTFFSTLKHSKRTFQYEQSSIVRRMLQLLYPDSKGTVASQVAASTTDCVVKEGTIFFYGVLADILAWERDLYSQGKKCPLSSELQRLNQSILYITLIRGRLTDMEAAEAIFPSSGSRHSERHIRDMWDVRLNAAAICKRIRLQRSSVVQGKIIKPQVMNEGITAKDRSGVLVQEGSKEDVMA